MGSFDYISIFALFGYLILFLMFLAAKKDKIINSFLLVLVTSICWTGGSYLMRIQMFPSYGFWYNVSICGLIFIGYSLFSFVNVFAGEESRFFEKMYFAICVLICGVNCATGFFLKKPDILVNAYGTTYFHYDMGIQVSVLFLFMTVMIVHMMYIVVTNCQRSSMFQRQIQPVILGTLSIAIGHFALLIPAVNGFPADILAGIVNALFMFYALVKRHLFRLQMLASEGICYVAAMISSLLLFYNLSPYIMGFLESEFPTLSDNYMLIFAAMFLLAAMLFAYAWKKIVSAIFIKDELIQQNSLQEFTLAVSKSLKLRDIYDEIIKVIKKGTDIQYVYICMQTMEGQPYKTVFTERPLGDCSLSFAAENPLIVQLKNEEDSVIMKDFRFSVAYKAMWEKEKRELEEAFIEYAIALKDGDSLVGVILFSNGEGKKAIREKDLSFLNAVGSVASIAIKNSQLYERVYQEAITDELTGLLNRKFFQERMEQIFEQCKDTCVSLILINVDDFKLYNQLYGNERGDRALQKIADIIRASVGENGEVCRYSGKEFSILLPQYDVLGAKNLAESIQKQVYNMDQNQGDYAIKKLTISVGISAYPFGARTIKEMMDNVDLAVYHVKRSGKNAIRIFDTVINGENPKESGDAIDPQNVYMEYESTIFALTAAIDTKDHYTFRHSNNVAYYATSLAKELGMNAETVEVIRQAALLHDIGKIGIPEQILNKTSKLTEEEYEIVQGHVEASIGIIKHLPSLDYVIPAVIGHHERYDGHGYPRKIEGKNIPATARVLCIADSFDAIVSKRCYKSAVPLHRALQILTEEAGKQFDPHMVKVFIKLLEKGTVKVAASEEDIQSQSTTA